MLESIHIMCTSPQQSRAVNSLTNASRLCRNALPDRLKWIDRACGKAATLVFRFADASWWAKDMQTNSISCLRRIICREESHILRGELTIENLGSARSDKRIATSWPALSPRGKLQQASSMVLFSKVHDQFPYTDYSSHFNLSGDTFDSESKGPCF